MDKKEISTVLQEVALLLELKGENPFKVKAYSNAARSIEILEEDLEEMIRQGRLNDPSLPTGHRLEIVQICKREGS